MQRKGCWYGFITIPQSAALTAPFAQGSRKTRGNQRFIATTAAAFCLPCVREGGARSATEGLLVRIHYNPSVSKLTAPFTQGSRKTRGNQRFIATTAEAFCLPCVRECGARSATEGLLATISNNPSVSRAGKRAATSVLLPRLRRRILPSLCKGRWRTKCAGRVVGENL